MIRVGLDLPQRYITACGIADDGPVVAEHRRLPYAGYNARAWGGFF